MTKRIFKLLMYDQLKILEKTKYDTLMEGYLSRSHFNSIGVSFLVWSEKISQNDENLLQIWNINQNPRFSNIHEIHARGSIGIIITFDASEYGFAEKLEEQINYYMLSSKIEPLIIGLYGWVPNNAQDQIDAEYIEEAKIYLKSTIVEEWDVYVEIYFHSSEENLFFKLLQEMSKIAVNETITFFKRQSVKKYNSLITVINKIAELFPQLENRIELVEEGVKITGKIKTYFIDTKGSSYICGRKKMTSLCLEDSDSQSSQRYRIAIASLKTLLDDDNQFINPSIIKILSKTFYLLNDEYFMQIDSVFKKQIS